MSEINYVELYYKLRRQFLDKEFNNLNSKQKEAVFTTEGPLLVLAGAGSGKTTVLVSRIANIIKYGNAYYSKEIPDNVTPSDIEYLSECIDNPEIYDEDRIIPMLAVNPAPSYSIMALTFTNKAASEMKERISRIAGNSADSIWASTFHSSCVKILRINAERLNYNRQFTIYDSEDSQKLMKDIFKDLNISTTQLSPKSVLAEISSAKDKLISPAEYEADTGSDYRMHLISRLYTAYQKRLISASAMDFDDLIVNTVRLFEENPDVINHYQNRFRYILVDEYQDTNLAQYKLISMLAGTRRNLCVVGDDDQSIYGFRGATIENILNFESNFPSAKTIKLEQNYRSTKNILDAANNVIVNNHSRKGKNLWTSGAEGELITIYTAEDENDEAIYIAGKIIDNVAADFKWSDHAVLYRMNAQSNSIEKAFRENAVPYRMIGGTRFYDRAEIKDMLAYLHIIANPEDELRMIRIINTPARGISNSAVETIKRLSRESRLPFIEILRKVSSYSELSRQSKAIQRFTEMIDNLNDYSVGNSLPDLYDELLDKSGYRGYYETKSDDESKSRLENIKELKTNIISYSLSHEEPSLEDFLSEVSLISDIDRYDDDADAVILMTIHNAKGLEFPCVFICGMEEDIFPSFRSSSEPEAVEEERRLAYVGITRAKKNLTLLCAKRRMLFGRTGANMPSRFLNEIPMNLIKQLPDTKKDKSSRFSASNRLQTSELRDVSAKASINMRDSKSSGSFGFSGTSNTAKENNAHTGNDISAFTKGARVIHRVFGGGIITSCAPMGNDLFLVIEFDRVGVKKFMAKTAVNFMSVVQDK